MSTFEILLVLFLGFISLMVLLVLTSGFRIRPEPNRVYYGDKKYRHQS